MPPTKRSPMKVPNTSCRVCASNNPVMLELFGSETQPVSYAEDVIKCLSLEVKQDDGLPSKICIKCAGVIGDYRPFVDKTLAAESERNSKCDSTSGSSTSCYFCLTSGTILFPVPEASINKSKDCFGIDVSGKEQICVRCQFLLEGLHEMKQKSSAASKQFSSISLSVKKKFSPVKIKEEREQSVGDIVDSSKDKIIPEKSKPEKKLDKEVSVVSKTDKVISVSSKVVKEEAVSPKVDIEESLSSRTDKEVSASSKADKEMSVSSKADKEMSGSSKTVKKLSVVFKTDKDVCLCLQDIVRMFGEEFFRGTVSAAKVLARLHGSPQINGYEPVKVSSSKSSKELSNRKTNPISKKNDKLSTIKKMSKLEKKSRRLSKVDIQTEAELAEDTSSKAEDGTALEGRKRSRESSEPESDVSLKKTRRRSNSEKSEPEKSAADTTQDTLDKDPLTSEKDAIPEKEEDKPANESAALITESEEEIGKNREKKRGRKPKIKKEKTECESSSDVPPKPSQPSIVRPSADTSLTENGLDPESARPKRKTKKVEFAMDHEDENDDEPLKSGTRRKRRNSEDEFYDPKGKDRVKRKPRQSYNSEDENDTDDTKLNVTVDQPEYMDKLDKLLESTPKNAFKPFICSVCHEGYISTVKGKLHKLVAHDPHSNLVLELTRCDHGKSGSDGSVGEMRITIKVEAPEDDPDKLVINEDTSEQQKESGDAANDLDDLFDGEKSTPNPAQTASDFDDLFDGEKEKSAPNPAKNSEDLFNSLFSGTKTQDSDKDSAAADRIDTEKTIDKSSQSEKGSDSVDSDPLSMAEKEPEKSSEEVSKVDCKEPSEEISKPEGEKASEEEASKVDYEKSPEEVSKPESEKSSAEEVSKPDCDKSSEEEVSKPDCEEPSEEFSKPECEKSPEEEVSKSDSSEPTEEGTIKPAEDETSEPKCVKPPEVEENCEAGADDVKETESEKDGSVEAPEPATEMEVKEPLPETCNRPDDEDGEEKAEGVKENSTSNDEEILNSEKCDQTKHDQSTDKQSPAENEEAVSSSIVEDKVPSPVPAEEKRGDLQNNGSEADESDCGDSPDPVKNDVASEPCKKINDCVDSTTAALDIPHDKVEDNLLISDKDVEPSSVVPDSSGGNYDGIVVGDD